MMTFGKAIDYSEEKQRKKKNKQRPPRRHFTPQFLNKVCKAFHPEGLQGMAISSTAKQFRGHIRNVLGTQQPVITCRTGMTTLTTSGTNLTQVVAMDVSGTAGWSSFAALFDEYRVRRARLHVIPLYQSYGASATALAALPVICVIDYDDSTALASLTAALQYDTHKIMYLGDADTCTMDSKPACPEGQPDLAWVTTASPVSVFWWKFWSITNLVPATAAVGYCFIEFDIEFRQLA